MKKWIGLLIIFFVLFSTIGSLSAVKLVNRDFDEFFTMKVPKEFILKKMSMKQP